MISRALWVPLVSCLGVAVHASEGEDSPLQSYFRAAGVLDEELPRPSSLWCAGEPVRLASLFGSREGVPVEFGGGGGRGLMSGVPVPPVVLVTESGEVIQRELRSIGSWSDGVPRLELELGFTTDEAWEPGVFTDSFTVGVQNAAGERLYLVTADASGFLWAPTVPDTAVVDEGDIARTPVPFGAPGSVLGSAGSFSVGVDLPAAWAGQELTAWFELFDNQDGIRSAGYFSRLTLVPEPGGPGLVALGGLCLAVWCRGRSRDSRVRPSGHAPVGSMSP